MRQIIYIDMDNVLVDFDSGIEKLDQETKRNFEGKYDEVLGIFSLMNPIDGAIESVHQLAEQYEIYVLSTAPWLNPSAWKDKIEWIHKYFGKGKNSVFYKRLIISHHKNLNYGDYLIDDRTKNGAGIFKGEHIHFGTELFPDWESVIRYLKD